MSGTISVQQASGRLGELLGSLGPGDEIVLTENDEPVAKIVPARAAAGSRRPGSCKGMLVINAEDDEHLSDFKEYMP